MAQPRSQLVSTDSRGVYHCVQRCVRRAWLCGLDEYTGESFEHRKAWVEHQIALIGECFAVAIHAYSVMSNHLHVVLELDPAAIKSWTDHDVAQRWVKLFPPRSANESAFNAKVQNILVDENRIKILRQRLGNLSWLMKCLAEPIARRANAEDICKGRFWEGRFKSQLLTDDKALLAAMAYVDLNPIRAGMTNRVDFQHHTSVKERIRNARTSPQLLTRPLAPLCGTIKPPLPNVKLKDYLELVEWTGKQMRDDKPGSISKHVPSIVHKIEDDANRWPIRVKAIGSGYWRVVGEVEDLIEIAKQLGQSWLCGVGFAASILKTK